MESIDANPDPRPRKSMKKLHEFGRTHRWLTGECWNFWSSELPHCSLLNYHFLPGAASLPWQYLVWSASLWSTMCIPRVTITVPWLPVQGGGRSTFKCPKYPTKSFNLSSVHVLCRPKPQLKLFVLQLKISSWAHHLDAFNHCIPFTPFSAIWIPLCHLRLK